MEQKEKNQLEMMINQMEQKLVSGGNALEEKEREAAQKYRDFQKKLKKQRKKQQELEDERKRKEDELINVQKQYQNLEDEVDDNRKVIKLLKSKYQDALNEI